MSGSHSNAGLALVLVIEDLARVREQIIEILRFEGFEARGAANGHSGLQLARSLEPDLILCDIGLPDIDGFEVLEFLRRDPGSSTIPLIFLTAMGDREAVRRGMQMGANDYIVKPYNGAELVAAVRARLELRATEKRSALGDMHDHLGALLTDIDLNLRLMLRDAAQRPVELPALENLAGTVREAVAAFRDGLAAANDLALIEADLLDGLHLIVVRRYALFERRIKFSLREDAPGTARALIAPDLARPIFLIVQELITNDLKHGVGEAALSLRVHRQELAIRLDSESGSSAADTRSVPTGAGLGLQSLRDRVSDLRGSLNLETDAERFSVHIRSPIVGAEQTNAGG